MYLDSVNSLHFSEENNQNQKTDLIKIILPEEKGGVIHGLK